MANGSITRRAALAGSAAAVAGAAVAVERGALPGRRWLPSSLGGGDVGGAKTVSGSFVSASRRGRRCGYTIAYPTAAAERLPVVVVLHARGANHRTAFTDLGLGRVLQSARHRFALAAADGGDTYWHRRASGEDSGAMVIREFLPLLHGHGLDTGRIGLFGWSMGGFGTLSLAGVLGARRVAAATALSPALWHRPEQTAAGAYDDPADFAAHDVFTHLPGLAGIGIRVDCGTADGFCPTARDYLQLAQRELRPAPAGGFEPGGHTVAYWRQAAPAQLAFLAGHLG
ncbi:MAG TPA: hypothetical protein VMB79_04615 [Jatrophihabitans sp.]|nr:hypothetical protein [Jatrophihabitans sp.]